MHWVRFFVIILGLTEDMFQPTETGEEHLLLSPEAKAAGYSVVHAPLKEEYRSPPEG